ncbi:nucleotide disphospho-sugar-binding domain-containing protein [Amycolatopsis sp. NPDC058278]|uniref:nucleotide disphospho-sugar-binding domain-containing protein n=1 Tax=Amycolatopsis sp. NPDC058278 TaxID=3346417 RepID=UPI0036DA5373
MRVLLVSWAWPSHVRPLVPIGWAFRAAGHDVRFATQPRLAGAVTGAGLPAVSVGGGGDHTALLARAMRPIRPAPDAGPAPGRGTGKRLGLSVALAEDMAGDLEAFCRSWAPDLVLYEPTTYAAPLVAAKLGLPHVRVLWGVDFHSPARAFENLAFAELCGKLGIGGFDSAGTVTVDPCPPSLQVEVPGRVLRTRYVPYNGTGAVPGWLWTEPRHPRVVLTWGVSPQFKGPEEWAAAARRMRALVAAIARPDLDLVVAVPSTDALGADLPDGVRLVENLPLHLVLPSSAVLISRGGAGSMMTGVAAGVRQVVVPEYFPDLVPAQRLAATGAGALVEDDDPEAVRAALDAVLADEAAAGAARRLRSEVAAQATLDETVGELRTLAGSR